MIEFMLGVVVGALIGWNLVPQPAFVKRWVDKVTGRETEE